MLLNTVIKEESDLMQRPLLPKRKNGISSVLPRTRFTKPRPNINALVNKSSKDEPVEQPEKGDDTMCAEKESDMQPRPLLPKRANGLPSAPRARFQRARPNLGALMNKVSKDTQSQEKSETLSKEAESPQAAMEKNMEPRPLLHKHTTGVRSSSRARFYKTRPNIGTLMNKAPKDRESQKDKSSSSQSNSNVNESYIVNLDKTNSLQKESTLEDSHILNMEKESPLLDEIIQEEVKIEFIGTAIESLSEVDDNIDITTDHLLNNTVAQELSNLSDCQVLNTCNDYNSTSKVLNLTALPEKEIPGDKLISSGLLITTETEKAAVARSKVLISEKESSITTHLVNKNTDYPTLKSILNSPRKRATAKKVHERRKKFANTTETPLRSEMTMVDLIYWNPTGSPMKCIKTQSNTSEVYLPSDENTVPPAEEEENLDDTVRSTPKVTVNADGEIIIDESSLLIKRKETIDHSIGAVVENDNTTYSSFRKKCAKQWTNRETAKFYKALSLVGTDFALMENIFTVDGKVTRTRRELKLKFKREEKLNTKFVYRAMYESQTYDVSILDEDHDDIISENEESSTKNKKNGNLLKKRNKDKNGENMYPTDIADIGAENSLLLMKKKRGRKKKSNDAPEVVTDESDQLIVGVENQSALSNNDRRSSTESLLSHNANFTFPENVENTSSRSRRIRKTKVMTDFVTDVHSTSDSDASDEIVDAGENYINSTEIQNTEDAPGGLKTVDISNTADEKCSTVLDSEFHRTQTKKKRRIKDASIKVQECNTVTENSACIENLDVVCLSVPNTQENILSSEMLGNSHIDNLLKLSDSSACQNLENDNILTNAAISEVVTSDKVVRRIRKKAVPTNLSKGLKRPQLEDVSKQSYKLPNPSFTNYTPTEDEVTVLFSTPPNTSKRAKRETEHLHVPDMLETNASRSSQFKDLEHDIFFQQSTKLYPSFTNFTPIKDITVSSFPSSSTPKTQMDREMHTPSLKTKVKNNTLYISPLQKTLNVPSGNIYDQTFSSPFVERIELPAIKTYSKSHTEFSTPKLPVRMVSSLEEPLYTPEQLAKVPKKEHSTVLQTSLNVSRDSVSIPVMPDNNVDPAPVMIFTKSPNAENILHLFIVKNTPENNF